MANANLADILNKPATDFVAPPPLPAGGYHCVVTGLPEQIESSKKKTPGFRFTLTPIAHDEDVDEAELAEVGGLEGKTIRNDQWLTEGSAFMLREFLEHCGISSEGKTLSEMIDESPNTEVMVYMRHEPTDRGSMRAVIAKTAPVQQG